MPPGAPFVLVVQLTGEWFICLCLAARACSADDTSAALVSFVDWLAADTHHCCTQSDMLMPQACASMHQVALCAVRGGCCEQAKREAVLRSAERPLFFRIEPCLFLEVYCPFNTRRRIFPEEDLGTASMNSTKRMRL
jgi:hypothetical protein